ncbi:hypothetical protein MPH_05626 [Macrophomina phaseolina MS6]|uniref:Uncharacterized protein n=1 Tax=Macrophomina phaseolina (strain MS6) TaxID=1126212 RepID=K2RWT0_MACPH|nr:hypothetical protein MPH_05626 [Macrophomina phaseolina MS6]
MGAYPSSKAKAQPNTTPPDGLCFDALTWDAIYQNADLHETRDIKVKLLWRTPMSDEYQGLQFPYNYLRTFCTDFLKENDRHYGFHQLERPDPDNIYIVIPGRVRLDGEVVALVLKFLRDAFAERLRSPIADVEFKPFKTGISNNLAVFTALKVLKIEPLRQAWEQFVKQALWYGQFDSVRDLKFAYDLFASDEDLVQGMLENYAYRVAHHEHMGARYSWERPQDELILGIPIAKAGDKVREVLAGSYKGHKKWLEDYKRGVEQFSSWIDANGRADFEVAKIFALQGSFMGLT